MTLATRCPGCQTLFKVVPDQLRVSEGWVRCGRCAEVFNAAQHLVDPDTGQTRHAPIEVHRAFMPPVAAGEPASAAATGAASSAAADDDALAPPRARDYVIDAPSSDDGPQTGPADARGAPLTARAADSELPAELEAGQASADATTSERAGAATGRAGEAADVGAADAAGAGAGDAAPGGAVEPTSAARAPDAFVAGERPPVPPAEPPSFVRAAERAARWRRPGVRALLLAAVAAALALLAAQWLYVYRDYAAARWPALRPMLEEACGLLGCRVAALRAIDALVVDSSGLVRVDNSELYRLSVALRNQRDFDVALPALDLALTDLQGRPIARRVLRAAELGASAPTLAGGGELALQATLEIAAAPVSGYTIELFYP